MQIFMFHLMPYLHLDREVRDQHRTNWIELSNEHYDPIQGAELYNRYLDELELAAELGFDGISVNEHHQTAYGMMPSPVVMAAALARRTKECRIAILGNAFCLRDQPLILAEEHAMLDNITRGRLISGMVRGIGAEYYSMGVNPTFSHARFREAHDLVVKAWTTPGPFAFEGEHYSYEYVNLWPRPYQQPHPPIWCPSTGSNETIEWASHPSRKYTYIQTYSPFASVQRYLNMYRETAEKVHGYTASSDQLAWAAPVYVAETDELAREQAGRHIEDLFARYLKMPPEMQFPPGYISAESMAQMRIHRQAPMAGEQTVDRLIELGTFVCGSPDTVAKQLTENHRQLGFNTFIALLQFGGLSRELTEQNIRLFAKEVMPRIKPLTDRHYEGSIPSIRQKEPAV